MVKSLWIKFLILLFSVSMISLSASLFLREMIITDFEEYLEGKTEDKIYRIMAAMEGSYEKYQGWNQDALKENAVWALLLGYRIRVLDADDRELLNTKTAMEALSPMMKKRIMAVSGISPDTSLYGQDTYTSYPLFLGGEDIGQLEIEALPTSEDQGKENIFLSRSNRFLVLSLFIVGGLSIILGLIFSKKLTDPIKSLTTAAREISEGNITRRVPVKGNDEMSRLALAFNTMSDNLEIQESLRRKLTANIAHELRTPLSAIQGELEGMIDGLITTDRERLLSLHEETNRLKTIIEGLEELSRAQASVLELRKQTVAMKPFLNNIRGRFEKMSADKGIALNVQCDDVITLHADPDKLSQIVINLLSNAMRATDRGGTVLMKAGSKGNEGFVEISDTGSGIKKEDLPFVFERFYKGSEGGLGLGLTIANELVEAHGGRIKVKSEPGEGSTFTVFLPQIPV
jgi:two-component system sensor histidine kinase BaeS